jgi:hypothetical protein
MRYILQASLALGLLIGLPLVLEPPETVEGTIGAAIGALILVGLAFRGVVGFVNSRRPKRYADSIMVPKEPPKPKA